MTSSCPKIGSPCGDSTDCGNKNCLYAVLCSTSGTCQSGTCSQDSDCSKFGDGYVCNAGSCTPNGCSSSKPCPRGMTCNQGICESISCDQSFCPKGLTCTKLSDGSKVCLSNPGIGGSFRLIVIVFLIVIIATIIMYVIYAKTGISPLRIFQ